MRVEFRAGADPLGGAYFFCSSPWLASCRRGGGLAVAGGGAGGVQPSPGPADGKPGAPWWWAGRWRRRCALLVGFRVAGPASRRWPRRAAGPDGAIRPHFCSTASTACSACIRANPAGPRRRWKSWSTCSAPDAGQPQGWSPRRRNRPVRALPEPGGLRLGERLQVAWRATPGRRGAGARPSPAAGERVFHGIEAGCRAGHGFDYHRAGPQVVTSRSPTRCRPERPAAGNRMALDNIRERLMLFYDLKPPSTPSRAPTPYRVRIVLFRFRSALERPRP